MTQDEREFLERMSAGLGALLTEVKEIRAQLEAQGQTRQERLEADAAALELEQIERTGYMHENSHRNGRGDDA